MNKNKKDPDIFGEAIKDYFEKGVDNEIIVHSPDLDDDVIPVSYLFRSYSEMPALEQKALNLCSGKVLDVGCGAGSHGLYLQNEKNLNVTGIDTSAGAIEICKLRGLNNVRKIAFQNLQNEKYDTILFLMNGTGIIGKLKNIDRFFQHLNKLLNLNGQVLIDSSDLKYLFEPDENGGIWIDASEKYYGELQYQLSYKDLISDPFDWLYLDLNSLNMAADANGFNCELIQEGEHYDYLAKLTKRN